MYFFTLFIHLLCAIFFIGYVFLMLSSILFLKKAWMKKYIKMLKKPTQKEVELFLV